MTCLKNVIVGLLFFTNIVNAEKYPIGFSDSPVYDFIKDFLIEKSKEFSEHVEQMIEVETNLPDDCKTHIICISEGELPSILSKFCNASPDLYEIILYKKNGVGVAYGSKSKSMSSDQQNKDKLQLEFPSQKYKKDLTVCDQFGKSLCIGILSPELIKKIPLTCEHKKSSGKVFVTKLESIYLNHKNKYAYMGEIESKDDTLIGYISTHQSKD